MVSLPFVCSFDPPAMANCPSGYEGLFFPLDGLNIEEDRLYFGIDDPVPEWRSRDPDAPVGNILPIGARAVIAETTITDEFRKAFKEKNGKHLVEDRCGMEPRNGYWCFLPGKNNHGMNPSGFHKVRGKKTRDTYIPVNLHLLNFGVRFPLHGALQLILKAYNLSLNQVVPPSMLKVISWIWVCEFFNFPLTLDLFRSLFELREHRTLKGMYSFATVPGRLVCYPTKDDLKDWKDKVVWVRVPREVGHKYWYRVPVVFKYPNLLPKLQESELQSDQEKMAYRYFASVSVDNVKKPAFWLPRSELLCREDVLCSAGLGVSMSLSKHL